MRITVIAYDSLGDLITVELSMDREDANGAELPMRFMGRSSVPVPPAGYGVEADAVHHVSRVLAQMALDLAGDLA